MTKSVKFVLAASLVAISAQATAAVVVVGDSRAADCYQSAEYRHATATDIAVCRNALAEDPLSSSERVATNVNLGVLHFFRRDYAQALSLFETALRLDPQEPEAVLNKAITIMRRDESGSEALPLFSQAIAMGTRDPALAYYGRGLANQLNGDYTAAYYDIQRASQIAPEWSAPREGLTHFIVERRGS